MANLHVWLTVFWPLALCAPGNSRKAVGRAHEGLTVSAAGVAGMFSQARNRQRLMGR